MLLFGCFLLIVSMEKAKWLGEVLALKFYCKIKRKKDIQDSPVFAISLLNSENLIFFLICCKNKNSWMFTDLRKQ